MIDGDHRLRIHASTGDEVFAEAIRKSRVVLGESGAAEELAALDKTLPVTGLAMLGEGEMSVEKVESQRAA